MVKARRTPARFASPRSNIADCSSWLVTSASAMNVIFSVPPAAALQRFAGSVQSRLHNHENWATLLNRKHPVIFFQQDATVWQQHPTLLPFLSVKSYSLGGTHIYLHLTCFWAHAGLPPPNSILIDSAIFAGLTIVTNTHTDHTLHQEPVATTQI